MLRKITSEDVSNRELDILERVLRRHYNLGNLIHAKRNVLGYMNANYEVETEKGQKRIRSMVRVYRPGLPKEDIDFEHTLLKELSRRSFHYAPQPIHARTGHSYVQTEQDIFSEEQGYYAAVFEYKEGEDKYSWDRPLCTDEELRNSAAVLAHYHTIIHRWTPRVNAKSHCTLENLPDMCQAWQMFRRFDTADAFSAHFDGQLDFLCGRAKRLLAWKAATDLSDLPIIAVHGDYHPGNLKYRAGRVVAVLDFDWSHMDYRIYDIGLAVFYFCGSWQTDSNGRIRLDRMDHFLKAYQRAAKEHSWIEPLFPDETACLPQMIQLANLFIIDWAVNHYFTRGGATVKYMEYLQHGVRVAQWLENNSQRLIEAIAAAN